MPFDIIIISSCIADEKVLHRLITTLKASGQGVIDACWSHRSVKPGEQRSLSFAQALSTAQVAVLLVTQDYLTDDDIQNELPQLIALAEKKEIRLIPVPVRAVDWERQPFYKYQPIWPTDRPLAVLKGSEQDGCYVTLGKLITELIEKAQPQAPRPPAPPASPEAFVSTTPSGPAEPPPAATVSPQTTLPANASPSTSKGWNPLAIITGIVLTGSLFGAVVDVEQLINLPLALVITAGVAIAFTLRNVGPWRERMRRNHTWFPISIGILLLIWGVYSYKQLKQPTPNVTISVTVLDRDGRLVYDANVSSPQGKLAKVNDHFVLTLDKPVPPFKIYASRGQDEKGETQIGHDHAGTYTATIHLTAAPTLYTLRLSIIDESGAPVPEAEITTPIGELKRTDTAWEITIAAVQMPREPFKIHATADEGLSGSATVSLTDKDVQVVEIQMSRDTNAVLEGKVLDQDSQPIKGASVLIEGFESEAQTTDENGRFNLKAHKYQDGWVRVIVKREGQPSFNQHVKVTGELVTLVVRD